MTPKGVDVMYDDVLITGITSLDLYPDNICKNLSKQTIVAHSVCIPTCKPDLESINEVKASIKICSYKQLESIMGPKLIINGIIKVKVIYTACTLEQSVHSAHWEIPFCDFIILKKPPFNRFSYTVKDLFPAIESVCINENGARHVSFSILYILCPLLDYHYPGPDCKKSRECFFGENGN